MYDSIQFGFLHRKGQVVGVCRYKHNGQTHTILVKETMGETSEGTGNVPTFKNRLKKDAERTRESPPENGL